VDAAETEVLNAMSRKLGLNVRERRFIDAYLGSCGGNATEAAIAAGYRARTRKVAQNRGTRLLSKALIRAAIDKRLAKAETRAILTAEERDTLLSRMAKNPTIPPSVQVSAVKELNKCSGRHSIRHVLDVTEKLSDIIAGSRG
jgi:hypothetical protein